MYALGLCLSLTLLVFAKQVDFATYDFVTYTKEYSKQYDNNEYHQRKAIFDANLRKIQKHNSDPTHQWKQGVNQFTDHTEEEKQALLGLDKRQLRYEKAQHEEKKRMDRPEPLETSFSLPKHVDWREKSIISPVKDQGRCGSCWAFGTTETVESYWALATGQLVTLSEQQVLDCTPNPNHCGGTGGCGGGTAQIAMDQIKALGGQTTEWMYPYTSYYGDAGQCHYAKTKPYAKLKDWKRLPMNQQDPVLEHLATKGPLIINVDASTWHNYESGVFDGCNKTNPDINHVVQLVGYGTDHVLGDYWLVRNSWTPNWGEYGYIRLKRTAKPTCGTDLTPQDGDICNGGPKTVTVCGTCGVIYDTTYPIVDA